MCVCVCVCTYTNIYIYPLVYTKRIRRRNTHCVRTVVCNIMHLPVNIYIVYLYNINAKDTARYLRQNIRRDDLRIHIILLYIIIIFTYTRLRKVNSDSDFVHRLTYNYILCMRTYYSRYSSHIYIYIYIYIFVCV
jgi:hypothetical protein